MRTISMQTYISRRMSGNPHLERVCLELQDMSRMRLGGPMVSEVMNGVLKPVNQQKRPQTVNQHWIHRPAPTGIAAFGRADCVEALTLEDA